MIAPASAGKRLRARHPSPFARDPFPTRRVPLRDLRPKKRQCPTPFHPPRNDLYGECRLSGRLWQ